MKMKTVIVLACMLALFAVVQADNSQVKARATLAEPQFFLESPWVAQTMSIWERINNFVRQAIQTVTNVVVTPILNAVAAVQEAVIAPITNSVNTMALKVAANQFCNLAAVPLFARIVPTLDANVVKAKCVLSAEEEITKAFSGNYVSTFAE